jgi:hypothetical protein
MHFYKKKQKLYYDFLPPPRTAFRHKSYKSLTDELECALLGGKKAVFVCSSKQKIRKFVREFLGVYYVSYKFYTGLSDNVIQDTIDLNNVNVAWQMFNVLFILQSSPLVLILIRLMFLIYYLYMAQIILQSFVMSSKEC